MRMALGYVAGSLVACKMDKGSVPMDATGISSPAEFDAAVGVQPDKQLMRHNSGVTLVAACIGPIAYLIFTLHFAIDAVLGDEWNMIPFIDASLHGHTSLGVIWSQYGEPRIPIVRADLLAFGYFTHLNTRWAIILNACIWIAAYAVSLCLFKRYTDSPLTPIPVLAIAMVWFSLADLQNALWAFEVGWFLVVFAFMVMLFALLVPDSGRSFWMAVAIAAAVIASLSWIQGFVVWPIGLMCLLWWRPVRRKLARDLRMWIGAALATSVLYLIGYKFSTTSCSPYFGCKPTNPITHPVAAVHFFLVLVGNVIPGGYIDGPPHSYLRFLITGVAVLFASAWIIVQSWRFRNGSEELPLPLLLISFALLFDLTILWGRLGSGVAGEVNSNRYVMPNIVLVVAIVMYAWTHRPRTRTWSATEPWKVVINWTGCVAVLVFIVLQVAISTDFGVVGAQRVDAFTESGARIAVNLNQIPPDERSCMAILGLVETEQIPVLLRDHLAEFSSGTFAHYRSEGAPAVTAVCKKPDPESA